MKSRINTKFREAYRKLPASIREQAREAYRLFQDNPNHPSLQFKPVHPSLPIYSARITQDYRVLGVMRSDGIVWFWAGTHTQYDQLRQHLIRRGLPPSI